ncbi:MAG: acyl-ACP--UDP-N-acetylglucosamine O-acyltransferase [Gemmobacter sp.]
MSDRDPAIHPSAIVEDGARVASGVTVGPFCHVGAEAVLGEGVRLVSHVVIEGRTSIGPRTVVHPFVVLGAAPQHLRDPGAGTTVEIGSDCTIREHASIHRGTQLGGGRTVVGNGALIMCAAHVGHDCILEDEVILTATCALAGHVTVGRKAIVGGLAGVHQFCRIGAHAFIGGCAAVEADVIPFGSVLGNRARLGGLNLVGIKRAGLGREAINTLRAGYHDLFEDKTHPFAERVARVAAAYGDSPEVMMIVEFIRADARRPIVGAR